MKACFIGHTSVEKTEQLISSLKETVLNLIHKGFDVFLFGSKSEFDNLSWDVVTELRNEYPYIKRVYVRAAFQYIDKFYEEYLLNFYEETYYPKKVEKVGKCSYIERNYDMIDNSTCCVFYYNENYIVPLKQSKNETLLPAKMRNSGTEIAYKYAIKKEKQIINLYR